MSALWILSRRTVTRAQVPTTRALALCSTGQEVVRDMWYNGNSKKEAGAVVCRVAPSLVRFGTFQLPSSRGGRNDAVASGGARSNANQRG